MALDYVSPEEVTARAEHLLDAVSQLERQFDTARWQVEQTATAAEHWEAVAAGLSETCHQLAKGTDRHMAGWLGHIRHTKFGGGLSYDRWQWQVHRLCERGPAGADFRPLPREDDDDDERP